MPIDPSLITDTLSRWQSPQFTMPDPLAQYAKIQALKNGILQQQSDALDLQQKQQQIAGQKALDDAMTNAYTRNPDGSLELNADAVTNGLTQKGFGHLVPGLLKNFTDMKKSAADAQTAQVASKNATNDYIASALGTVYDSGFDPHVAIGALAHAVDSGIVPAQQAAALTAQIQQNPTPDGVKQVFAPLFAASPGFQERIDKAKTAQAAVDSAASRQKTADVAGDKLSDERIERVLNAAAGATNQDELNAARNQALKLGASSAQVNAIPMQFTPDAMKAYTQSRLNPEQRTTAAQAATNAAATEADRKITQAQRAQEIGISAAELALRNDEYQKKYGDALGNLSDNDKTIASKIASGDYSMTTLSRLPNKEQIMAAAIQINPTVAQSTYDTKQSFTNPEKTQAKNLGTISRIVSHIGRFEQNSKQMGLAPAYALGVNLTGNQATLNEDAHAIAGELEKLVSGGVGSEGQIQAWQKALHSPSAEARQKAVDEISQLVGGQYEGMNQTYKSAIGSDLPVEKYISPAGQAWMKTKAINVTNAAPGAGAAAAGAPPLPARLSSADVGKIYTNKAGKPIRVTAVNPADPTQFKFDAMGQ